MPNGEAAMPASGRGACVLLVEDEFLICAMMEDALIKHGFEVHAAANADDALEHLTCGAPCDLLLTDLNLGPGMDGATLAWRGGAATARLPGGASSGGATPHS